MVGEFFKHEFLQKDTGDMGALTFLFCLSFLAERQASHTESLSHYNKPAPARIFNRC